MAWSLVASIGAAATEKTSTSSWAPFSLSANAGEIIFVSISVDNTGTATPTISLDKPGGESNSWQQVIDTDSVTATADSGQIIEIWAITTSGSWSAHSLTVTLSAAVTAKVASWAVFSGGSLSNSRETLPKIATSAVTSTHTLSGAAQPQDTDLVLGNASQQSSGVPGADSDTTNGSWVTLGSGGTTGGTATSNVRHRFQYKIVTATGDQQFEPATWSSDIHTTAIALGLVGGTPSSLPPRRRHLGLALRP